MSSKQVSLNIHNNISLFTMASHDLRQSLNSVTLCVEAMEIDGLDDKQKKIIKTLKALLNTMERLLNTLLEISKLEAGVIQPDKKDFNLDDILACVRTEYTEISLQRQLKFQCTQTGLIADSDPILLEIIIRNLVANAFRYTQAGKIWITCKKHINNTLAIEIGDTGVGIHKDDQELIFALNYQINNPERNLSKGSGFGLSIVQNLANILDLELAIDSKLNFGTRFIITVPEGGQIVGI